MASHTKVEPVLRTPIVDPGSGIGATVRGGAAEKPVADAPDSSVEAAAEGTFGGDDEDVSLDELMMSDSTEEPPSVRLEEPAPSVAAEPAPAERSNDDVEEEPPPSASLDPYAVDPLDDEAAALAAAAAAQEAAAQAAEAEARRVAARRASEPPLPARSASSSEPPRPSFAADDDDAEPSTGQVAAVTAPPLPSEPSFAAAEDEDAPPSTEQDGPPRERLSDPLPEPPRSDARSARPTPPDARALRSTPPPGRLVLDAPLPSFDIPEPVDGRRGAAGAEGPTGRGVASPLPQLSELAEEDDDDAVTHIGLPVVPESPGDYAELGPTGFQVADPAAAALQGFEPDLSLADARRATTRVLPRVNPAQLHQQRRQQVDTNPSLSIPRRAGGVGKWLSGVFQRYRPAAALAGAAQLQRGRAGWLLDTVLPPLSLVLFGSGIGAGIMLLQPDRGAKAAQTQTIQSLKEAPGKRPVTLAERAEAGEGDALFKITNMAPTERTSALTLALERGYQAQRQHELSELVQSLTTPAGFAAPNLTNRFLNFATSPETMLPAFANLLEWPGTVGPDVLYAVWEKAPGGSRAASLAQQLLHSEDQRKKATPALLTALDLRSATTCEDYLRVLPAVQRDGDQRCSATLRALKHKDGCGDDGEQDCFACLRDGTQLDDALKAIEGRVPPQL